MTPSQPTVLTRGGGECHHQSDITVLLHQSKDHRHHRHGTEAHREERKKIARIPRVCDKWPGVRVCVSSAFPVLLSVEQIPYGLLFFMQVRLQQQQRHHYCFASSWLILIRRSCCFVGMLAYGTIWMNEHLIVWFIGVLSRANWNCFILRAFFCFLFGKQIKSYFLILDQNLTF